MSYCRYCGVEISYKRTKNDKWMPCNASTGEPHFCNESNPKVSKETGIIPCKNCGKPTFIQKKGKTKISYDYSTLQVHECKKSDITRYQKYQKKNKVKTKK